MGITMTNLNKGLIERQGLDEHEVEELERLHEAREVLFEVMMEPLDPTDEGDKLLLKTYAVLLESMEYNMQRVWKFNQDPSYHTWWYRVPHCKCPTMDNADPLMGYGGRIINSNCPIHGKDT